MTGTTFVTNNKGKRVSAIVPIKKYEHLLSEAEELEDIKAYDKAMRRKQEFIPLEEALKEIETTGKRGNNVPGVIERQAMKQLARIPSPDNTRITETLKSLAENPRPHGYKKLKGRPGYRYMVGDYRIIYTINDNILTIFVLLIGNRKNVYE